MSFLKQKRKAVAALITVLSIGFLIFSLSLTTSVLAFWINRNIHNIQKSTKAYYSSYSGIQDALIKLQKNKNFSGSFNLSIYSANDVSVSVSNTGSQAIATSTASFSQMQKRIQSIVPISTTGPATGIIIPTSTIELTL